MSCNLSGLSELELLFHNQSYGHPVVRWPSQKLCIDYYDALGCQLLLHQVKISDMICLQQITALIVDHSVKPLPSPPIWLLYNRWNLLIPISCMLPFAPCFIFISYSRTWSRKQVSCPRGMEAGGPAVLVMPTWSFYNSPTCCWPPSSSTSPRFESPTPRGRKQMALTYQFSTPTPALHHTPARSRLINLHATMNPRIWARGCAPSIRMMTHLWICPSSTLRSNPN